MPQGLEEAEQQFQKERTELDGLQMSQLSVKSSKTHEEESGEGEEGSVFQLRVDRRMVAILQDALYKCEQVITLTAER